MAPDGFHLARNSREGSFCACPVEGWHLSNTRIRSFLRVRSQRGQATSDAQLHHRHGGLHQGPAISPDSPASSGGAITSYSVSPSLPAGLALSAVTGIVSGTPATVAPAHYTVTASDSAGSTTAILTITVNDQPPSRLTTRTTAIYPQGVQIAPNTPTNTGGAVTPGAVSPALPTGLSLSAVTGIVSGAPAAPQPRPLHRNRHQLGRQHHRHPEHRGRWRRRPGAANPQCRSADHAHSPLRLHLRAVDPRPGHPAQISRLAGRTSGHHGGQPGRQTLLILTSGFNRIYNAARHSLADGYGINLRQH